MADEGDSMAAELSGEDPTVLPTVLIARVVPAITKVLACGSGPRDT